MKRIVTLLLVIAAVLALLCAGARAENTRSFGEISGGEVNAELLGYARTPGIFFSRLYYAPSTLPGSLYTGNPMDPVWLCAAGERNNAVKPAFGSLEFVSGDESLRDAVFFSLPDEGEDGNVYLEAALDRNVEPGAAVYRLKLGADGLYYESEVTFRVLSWEEYPLFEFRNRDGSGVAAKGEGDVLVDSFGNVSEGGRSSRNNTHLYTPDQIAGLVVRDHWAELANQLLTGDQRRDISEYMGRTGEGVYSAWCHDETGNPCYPQENLWMGWVWETNREAFQFRDYGEYRLTLVANLSNVQFRENSVIRVLPYRISGPASLVPGDSGTFTAVDEKPEEGRTFTLSAEGEGFTFDAETGTLTAAEDTPVGAVYTVTAVPSDGGPAVILTGKTATGIITGEAFSPMELLEGFSVPVPEIGEKYQDQDNQKSDYRQYAFFTRDETAPSSIWVDYTVYSPLDEFTEDADTARKMYTNYDGYEDYESEEILLDGHPALAQVFKVDGQSGAYSMGTLLYARNNRILQARVFSEPQNGTPWEDLPRVTLADLRKIAEGIVYDPAKASFTTADGAVSLTAKEGTDVLTAGKKLTLLAAFANPDKVNKKAKNDTVTWSVTDPTTGAEPEGVIVDAKGVVTAGKQIDQVLKVEVKAESTVFHTSAVFPVTVIPAVKKLAVEPAEIFFYTGTEASETVKAVLDPDTVPPLGITWTAAKEGIVEITPDAENGTAVIRPLAAGKAQIAVKEPGGKNAKLTVNVVAPVEDMTLEAKGKPVPGGTVTVKETLVPKQAGNKNVEWTLDVGEDIATVAKGKVKIAKTAPAGTVITVTCTALGAPEPVVRTVQIEVAEK